LSNADLRKRHKKLPEVLRKLSALFDVYTVIDLIFYALVIIMVTVWGAIIVSNNFIDEEPNNSEDFTKLELDEEDPDFFNGYNRLARLLIFYAKIAGTTTLLMIFRSMKYF
jgi:hypothetical protein